MLKDGVCVGQHVFGEGWISGTPEDLAMNDLLRCQRSFSVKAFCAEPGEQLEGAQHSCLQLLGLGCDSLAAVVMLSSAC